MKHIYLDKLFLLFLIIIILTGNFNGFFPYFFLLFIHELGHAITGVCLGYKLDKITFYPYGGVTTFNLPMNISLKKELFILIMGPIMQIIGYIILKKFYSDIKIYHYTLLIFNLLPIYPLDGGKILKNICGYFANYLKSFYITFYISLIFVLGLFIYNIKNYNFNMLLTLMVILYKLFETYKKRYLYYNRFLLERYLYDYSFRKVRSIKNIKELYRDTLHYINFQKEKVVLKKYFQNK